jgi:hypothetical protein
MGFALIAFSTSPGMAMALPMLVFVGFTNTRFSSRTSTPWPS